MNGILIVDKPEGITSAEVVRRIKRLARTKVGHLGTLDPFASGVLPLCLGEATKIAQFLNQSNKRYEGVIALGESTDTGDRTGEVIEAAAVPDLAATDVAELARRFLGTSEQTPPMYSALKHRGVPLYRLARQGIEIERAPRHVCIEELTLEIESADRLRFQVHCSKGTYVRVLAVDIGQALGTRAHLAELRRTRFGSFRIEDALVDLDSWDASAGLGLLSLTQALAHLPVSQVDERTCRSVRQGQHWALRDLDLPDNTDTVALLDRAGDVVAVVVRKAGKWRFGRVFHNEPVSLQ